MINIPSRISERLVSGVKKFQPVLDSAKTRDINESDTVVIITDMLSYVFGFDKYLSLNLNLRVEVANIWINNFDLNTYIPEISKVDSEDLAVVNGLNLI